MLTMQPLRFVFADDPGAGKTIMTGLLIKELIVREDVRRCLIVCPGALAEQWQDELRQKFHLNFKIFANDNDFFDMNRCIISTDKLARNNDLQDKLRGVDWDLIVCDEAHKMSATVWGNEIKYTKRFQLGQLLGKITRHFLLLTAKPHNGKEEDFHLFMSLIAPDRFRLYQVRTSIPNLFPFPNYYRRNEQLIERRMVHPEAFFRFSYQVFDNAGPKSSSKSTIYSIPTLTRTKSSVTPAFNFSVSLE